MAQRRSNRKKTIKDELDEIESRIKNKELSLPFEALCEEGNKE
jgi:hypothetical protein